MTERRAAAALMAAVLAGCSSAPPERSARADARSGSSPREAPPAPEAERPPERAADVSDAELAGARTALGCSDGEGGGLACQALTRFADASAPRWTAGALAGAEIRVAGDQGQRVRPALLAARGRAASVEISWAVVAPADPDEATLLAAMTADVLAGRPPGRAPEPWPGLLWRRPPSTEGPSARLDPERRVWVRQRGEETLVLGLDEAGPWLAVHRAARIGAP